MTNDIIPVSHGYLIMHIRFSTISLRFTIPRNLLEDFVFLLVVDFEKVQN